MTDQLANAVIHTTIGVTTTSQSNAEDQIQPTMVSKNFEGKILRAPFQQSTAGQSEEQKLLGGKAKKDITGVLTALVTAQSNTSISTTRDNRIQEEVEEQDIKPVLLTRDQRKAVMEVLSKWVTVESEKNESALHAAVSGVIASQRHSNIHSAPQNVTVNQIPEASTVRVSEDLTELLVLDNDHQNRHRLSQPDSSLVEPKTTVHEVKLNNINDLSPVHNPSSVVSNFRPAANQSQYTSKDESVPMALSNEHKEDNANMVTTCVNAYTSIRAPISQSTLTESELFYKNEDTNINNHFVDTNKVDADILLLSANAEESSHIFHQTNLNEVHHTGITDDNKQNNAPSLESIFEKAADISHDIEHVTLRSRTNQASESQSRAKTLEQTVHSDVSTDNVFDQVVMRSKTKQPTQVKAIPRSVKQTQHIGVSSSSSMRPKSMIESSPPATAASNRVSDLRKSFTSVNKSLPALRPLSGLRQLSMSTTDLSSSASYGRPASGSFTSSTFASRSVKIEYPKTRKNDGSPFQVNVLKGIVGIGLKVKVTSQGHVQITEIQRGGPVDKAGQVRVGDYLLFLNSTELTGQTDARVQQVLRLLPRGLTKLVVSGQAPESEPRPQLRNEKPFSAQQPQQLSTESQRTAHKTSTSHSQKISESSRGLTTSQLKEESPLEHLVTSSSSANASADKRTPDISILHNTTRNTVHNIEYPTKVVSSSDDAVHSAYSENTTHEELQDVNGSKKMHVDVLDVLNQPGGQVTITSSSHQIDFLSGADTTESQVAINSTSVVLHKTITDTFVSSQDASKLSSQQSPSSLKNLDKKDLPGMSQFSPKESPANKETLNIEKPPQQRYPPSVAPKPRLHSTTSITSIDSVDGSEPSFTKHQAKVSAGYERLLAMTKEAKSSTIIEKSGTFVSSTAKRFDQKATNEETNSDQTASIKRASLSMKEDADKPKTTNTSLKPVQNRWKHSEATSPTTSRSTSVSSVVVRPKSSTQEPSRRYSATVDYKSQTALASTPLNWALSPRKTSLDYSSTHPFVSTKRLPTVQDETTDRYFTTKDKTAVQPGTYKGGRFNLYKSASVTSLDNTSWSQEREFSFHRDNASHAREHFRKSVSSVQPPLFNLTSEPKEEVLDNTMKRFDELLIESPYERTKTDPHDLLLWSLVNNDSQTSSQSSSLNALVNEQSQVSEIIRPVPSPRKLDVSKNMETNIKEYGEIKLIDVSTNSRENKTEGVKAMKDDKQNKEETFSAASQFANSQTEDSLSSKKQVGNAVTCTMSEHSLFKSLEVLSRDAPDGLTIGHTILDITENESKKQNNTAEEFLKLLEPSNKIIQNTSENPEKSLKETLKQYKGDLDNDIYTVCNNQKANGVDKIEPEIVNIEVISDRDHHLVNDTPPQHDMFYQHASHIVNDVLLNLQQDLDISNPNYKSTFSIEPDSPSFSNDEPPPLPIAPPPLILKDTILPVSSDDLIGQNESRVVSENDTNSTGKEQASGVLNQSIPSSIQFEVNTHTGEFIITDAYDVAGNTNVSNADSIKHLRSSGDSLHERHSMRVSPPGDSFHERDNMRVNSPSPVDMLSEDSGMPADEDQEGATDDAISPPVELADITNGYETLNNTLNPETVAGLLSSQTDARSASSSATAQETQMSIITTQTNAETTLNDIQHQRDAMCDQHLENNTSDIFSPPLLPLSPPPSIHADSSEDLMSVSQTFSASLNVQTSGSQACSLEYDLLGDDFTLTDNRKLMPVMSVVRTTSESTSELTQKYNETHDTSTANDDLLNTSENVQDSTGFKIPECDDLLNTSENVKDSTGFKIPVCDDLLNTSENVQDSTGFKIQECDDLLNTSENVQDSTGFKIPECDDLLNTSENVQDSTGFKIPECDDLHNASENVQDSTGFKIPECDDLLNTSENVQDSTGFKIPECDDLLNTSENVKDSTGFKIPENVSGYISSIRKWCLRSNKSTSPVLVGEVSATVPVGYTEKTLLKALPYNDFASLVDKANAVLDTATGPVSLFLIIVHLHRDEDSIPLGVDLKHEGGIWFRVSGIKKDSPVWEEGGAKVGDWLVAVDSLWCDRTNVMRFLTRLSKPKHDSLLVFGRDEYSIAESELVQTAPTPDSGSSCKQQTSVQLTDVSLDKTHELQEDLLISTNERHSTSGRQYKPSVDKEQELQPLLSEKAPTMSVSAHELLELTMSQSDQSQPVIDQKPLLMNEVAPLPDQVSPLSKGVSSLPEEATTLQGGKPSLLEQATSLSERAPSLLEQGSPLPEKTPSLPQKAPPFPEQTPSLTQEISPLPREEPPLPQEAPPLPQEAPPLPQEAPPFPQDAPPLPQEAPPSLPQEASPLPQEAPPLPELLLPDLTSSQYTQTLIQQTSPQHTQTLLQQTSPHTQQSPTHPKQTSPLLEQTPDLPEQASQLPKQIPQLPKQTPPLSEQAPRLPKQRTPLSEQALPLPEKTPTVKEAPVKDALLHSPEIPGLPLHVTEVQQPIASSSAGPPVELGPGVHTVVMMKGATGVGFCLEGGIGSPKGDLPIIVKRIFKGGPAEKCGLLKVKDEILEVNGLNFSTMRHYEAWNHLKFLNDGEVRITIRRT